MRRLGLELRPPARPPTGNCCEMGCQSIGGGGGGGGEPTMDCPDINDDGVISVGDILAMLSAFGSDDAAADINDDGTVSVTDILGALSSFGDECSLGGGDSDGGGNGVVGGDDGSDGVNCCSGGSGCGYQHCPAIGDGQDGCVQPWNMCGTNACALIVAPCLLRSPHLNVLQLHLSYNLQCSSCSLHS